MHKDDRLSSLKAAFPLSIALAGKISRVEHLANPFVNILNLTVKSEEQYPDLNGQKGMLWRLTNSIMGAGVTQLRALKYWPKAIRFNPQKTKTDVVIISHLTHPRHLQHDADFYFGNLADDLTKAGFKTHTVLINHCLATASDMRQNSRHTRTLLPAFLPPWAEIKLLLRMFRAAFSLPPIYSPDHCPMFGRNAKLAQFNSRALSDYRIGMMILQVLSALKPKIVLHTFEGHGWERVMTTGLRKTVATKTPYIIGYQHAVIFPGKKSISCQRKSADGLSTDPDHIMTAGRITCNSLLSEGAHSSISVLGSVKANPVADPKFAAKGACLIAPEGTMSEVIIMADLAIKAARIAPHQDFILRLHPVLKRKSVQRKLNSLAPWPENFKLSNDSLDDDFRHSSWLCYRGSTVAFQGLRQGLRPIYLDPDDRAATNDPISPELRFRRLASDADDLIQIIDRDRKNPARGQDELRSSQTYANDYVMPLKPGILLDHIKMVLS